MVTVSVFILDSIFKKSTNVNYLLRVPTVKEKPINSFFRMLHLHVFMSRLNYLTEHITAKYFEVIPLEIP